MFIRFATDRRPDGAPTPLGVFAIAYQLVEDHALAEYERAEFRGTLDWFESNLPIPARFKRSRKPHCEDKGICWFKSSAKVCLTHIRYLVHLVSDQNVVVRELVTETPGYVIYEDCSQVVAERFADTPR